MIACVCSNYTEEEVASEIHFGAETLKDLQKIGICAGCKTCKETIIQLLRDNVVLKEK